MACAPTRRRSGRSPARPVPVGVVRGRFRTNPRNAGIAVYRLCDARKAGDPARGEVGRGEWEPVVPEEKWRAMMEILTDPDRKPARGVKTMLGGIGQCRCGNYLVASYSVHGLPAYRCNQESRGDRPGPHVQVKSEDIDRAVSRLVVARLSAPDAAQAGRSPAGRGRRGRAACGRGGDGDPGPARPARRTVRGRQDQRRADLTGEPGPRRETTRRARRAAGPAWPRVGADPAHRRAGRTSPRRGEELSTDRKRAVVDALDDRDPVPIRPGGTHVPRGHRAAAGIAGSSGNARAAKGLVYDLDLPRALGVDLQVVRPAVVVGPRRGALAHRQVVH